MANADDSHGTGLIGLYSRIAGRKPWSGPVLAALALGFVTLGFYAWRQSNVNAVAVALMIAGAALSVGAVTGFLFGIPKSKQEDAPVPQTAAGSLTLRGYYRTNTNLELISDWLTKIIVGLGLVQLYKVPEVYMSLADYVAQAFGTPAVPPSFPAVVMVYFGIVGFLACYLWTRLLLTGEFQRADEVIKESPEFAEGLIQALLYQPPPSGFEQALEASDNYLAQHGDGNWRVWRSTACGHAQKYAFLKSSPTPDTAALQAARDDALEAVRRVLAINPGEKDALRALWDPARASPQENDLTVFYGDPDFAALLGP